MDNLSLNIEDFKGSSVEKGFLQNDLEKGKKMPIGTVSKGRKKVAEGKWVPVKAEKKSKAKDEDSRFNEKNLIELHKLGTTPGGGPEGFQKYKDKVKEIFGAESAPPDISIDMIDIEDPKEFAKKVLNEYADKYKGREERLANEAKKLNANGVFNEKQVKDYLESLGSLEEVKGKTVDDLLSHTVNINLVKHSMNVVLQQTSGPETIQQAEKRLLETTGNRYESAIVLDKDGNQILGLTIGERSKIAFSEEQSRRLEGAAVFTHNHPSSRGLSPEDMFSTIKLGIKEMRAAAPKSIYGPGTWVMVNNYPNAGKSAGAGFQASRLATQMNLHEEKVRAFFEDDIGSKSSYPEQREAVKRADTLHFMEVAMHTETFKQGRIEFFFEDLNGNRKKLDHLTEGSKSGLDALYDI